MARLREKPFWFIVDVGGRLWLSTASEFSKRGSIANWTKRTGYQWKYWYRRGYRCSQFTVSTKPYNRINP